MTSITFQYMLLLRGATFSMRKSVCSKVFQYMLLLRGATFERGYMVFRANVSIHAPLARSNQRHRPRERGEQFQYMLLLRGATKLFVEKIKGFLFQYMLLLRGATRRSSRRSPHSKFQYMLLLRGATRIGKFEVEDDEVSIHAPLARSNVELSGFFRTFQGFNTCSSCEEQRGRRDTVLPCLRFNTCSSCEEQRLPSGRAPRPDVSIHAPLARSNQTVIMMFR